MPSVSGSRITELQISTDAAVGNYQELATDIVDTVNYNNGRVLEDRTRGGDAVRRYDDLKPNPSIQFTFDVNSDVDASWGVLMLDASGERAFTMRVGEARITGSGKIEGPTMTYNSQTGVAQEQLTIRPVGRAWVNTRDTS